MELKDDLLKGAEAAAQYLGVSARAVYRMAETNEIPVIRKGGSLFFRKTLLDAAFRSDPSDAGQAEECIQLKAVVEASRKARKAECTFSEMLPLFQELFEPHPTRLLALQARLKHLGRLGIHQRARGKGRLAYYDAKDLRKLLFAMELTNLGVSPKEAVDVTLGIDPFGMGGQMQAITLEGRRSQVVVDMDYLRDAAKRHLPQFFPSEDHFPLRSNVAIEAGAHKEQDDGIGGETHLR